MLDGALTFIGLSGLVFLLYLWAGDLLREHRSRRRNLLVLTVFAASVLGAGLWFVGQAGYAGLWSGNRAALLGMSVLVSGLISLSWYLYLRRLDHYEPEPFWPQLAVFALSCLAVFLVFPLSGMLARMGIVLRGDVISDFIYCVVGIGLVEEVVKILPVLILLRFSRNINEPFDYIMYGGISALGFAFVENILYLERYDLMAVNGRALYASVSHMFDTSIICYCMAIARFHNPSWRAWAFPVGLALASVAHGFYDFWLISPAVAFLSDLTLLFYLVTLYLWTIMKNNLMNLSNFFSVQERIRPSDYKYLTITGLVCALMLAAAGVHLFNQDGAANEFLWGSLLAGVFVLVFITITFSRIRVVSGYVAPFVPDGSLWLTIRRSVALASGDELGKRLSLGTQGKMLFKSNQQRVAALFPMQGTLVRNMVIGKQHYWYLMKLEQPLQLEAFHSQHVLIRAHKPRFLLGGKKPMQVEVRVVRALPPIKLSVVPLGDTKLLGKVYSATADQ